MSEQHSETSLNLTDVWIILKTVPTDRLLLHILIMAQWAVYSEGVYS